MPFAPVRSSALPDGLNIDSGGLRSFRQSCDCTSLMQRAPAALHVTDCGPQIAVGRTSGLHAILEGTTAHRGSRPDHTSFNMHENRSSARRNSLRAFAELAWLTSSWDHSSPGFRKRDRESQTARFLITIDRRNNLWPLYDFTTQNAEYLPNFSSSANFAV